VTDLVYKLASAIATEEGYFTPNSLPERNNNPGDLREAGSYGKFDGFVVFPSKSAGIAGLYRQICLDIFRGSTLRNLVYTWAPPGDNNNSEEYLNNTARRIGLGAKDINTPLWNFLEIDHIP
jgi:hypothetical protein